MKKSRYKDDLLVKRNFKPLKKEDLMTHGNLPRGGLGLEKAEMNTFKNVSSLKAKNSNNLNDKPIQCHTCKHNMICKYQSDYLEQIVHIVDVYNGAFELNCNYYETNPEVNEKKNKIFKCKTCDYYNRKYGTCCLKNNKPKDKNDYCKNYINY